MGHHCRAGTFPLIVGSMIGLYLGASSAALAKPVALVEDVGRTVKGVQVMDYLDEGRTITLKANETLELSYLESCTYEVISGGTVTVGRSQSAVDGGQIDRKQVPCSGGSLLLTAAAAGKSGVTVFRGAPVMAGALPPAQLTLFNTQPMVKVAAPGKVLFERLDQTAAPIKVNVAGKVLDFTKKNLQLTAGATYRATAGTKSLIIKIADQAGSGAGPALGRLIQF